MIQAFPGAEAVADAAALAFQSACESAIQARGGFAVVLSGGSTPRLLFQKLSDPPFRDTIDWSHVALFWGDERSVPPSHADSNFRMARETLIDRVPIPSDQVYRMQGESQDLARAASEYQNDIARSFDVPPDGAPPSFDLVLLGLGTDAHTASLFPGSPALEDTQSWVVSNPAPSLDTYRLTFTARLINAARQVLFLVAGSEKSEALRNVLSEPKDHQNLPAQLIQPVTGELSWFVDEAALGDLPESVTVEREQDDPGR